ncbi:MAG: uncharacterized protein QOG62_202 [Thermoleophilaceae bacterium]|nr:uncharacterized protein [Thermoleophilaceae bacterium]
MRFPGGTCAAVALAVTALLAASAGPAAGKDRWTDYERPATHSVTTDSDVPLKMRDGVVLRADVIRPREPGRYPTLVVQTPYNKGGVVNIALGGQFDYFVQRGYAVVNVDVRGTGSSGGTWDSFGPKEQADGPEVVEWAAKQPWSTGKIGLYGPSYMGLNQFFTAAQRPKHLRAMFPVIPMADAYRDITLSGGDINASFIPLWMGLVAAGGLTPPASALSGDPADLALGLQALASHAGGLVTFDANLIGNAAVGGQAAYDGPTWDTRSPIEVADRIRVPAFVVGGHHDLFQRGEPLLYERLKQHVPAHLLMGPWTHVAAASGTGLPADGVPAINTIALRWFDHYLRGKDTKPDRMPAVTQYVLGEDKWRTQRDWPDPRLTPEPMYLGAGKSLSPEKPGAGLHPQSFTQQPLSGICTQSTSQWTAGLLDAIPCTHDNRSNEAGEATYTTEPMKKPLELSGPILANLWVTTTASDAVLTVRVTDVAPGGKSTELTDGWLAGSFRAVDRKRSRYVDGTLMQPWHPFTEASEQPLKPGVPTRLPVEIFPTRASIQPGHRLRVSVGPSDFPHQLPPLPQLLNGLGGTVKVLTDPAHPSAVELPGLEPCKATPCKTLPMPRLVR